MCSGAWRPPQFPLPWSPRLTAVVLVAVVRAVVVLIASPHRGDAALVPTPKLVLFTLLDRPCGGWRLGAGSLHRSPLPTVQPWLPRSPAGIGKGGDTGELRSSKHLNSERGQDATGSSTAGPTDGTARPDIRLTARGYTPPSDTLILTHNASQVHTDLACGKPRTLATHARGAGAQSLRNLSLSSARRGPRKRIVRKDCNASLIIATERACQIKPNPRP